MVYLNRRIFSIFSQVANDDDEIDYLSAQSNHSEESNTDMTSNITQMKNLDLSELHTDQFNIFNILFKLVVLYILILYIKKGILIYDVHFHIK